MYVVTGATGNVGRDLVQVLAGTGEKVVAVSRHRPDAVPDGVRHEAADLTDAASLRPALDGGEVLFVLVPGEVAYAGDPAAVLAAAVGAGIRRVVLLSSQGAGTRPTNPSHAPLRRFEETLQASGLGWTLLRPGGFASNAFAWVDAVRRERAVEAPFGDVALPVVDPLDIAEVAAHVMRDDGHDGRAYVLTGPAPISPRQQAAAIGDAIGEPVRFVELSRDAATARMATFMPAPVVEGTLAILGEPTLAEQAVSPDVADLLGRPARTFARWAARNAAAFR